MPRRCRTCSSCRTSPRSGRRRRPGRPRPLEFLADLASTTKDEMRRSQDEQLPGEPFGRHQAVPLPEIVQVVSSSGTTGNPLYYALTAADLEVWRQAIAGAFFTAGIRPGDVVAHLVGLPGVAGGLPYADGFRTIGAALAWLGGFPTERILRSFPRLQVSAVLSTASFGTYLTDHCQEIIGEPAAALGVTKFLGGGEPGFGVPSIREKVRAGWGLDHVREVMGLADVLSAMWGECDDETGMHFCAAVGDVVAPYLRIWKERADQVRFDDAIPVDIEAADGLTADRYPAVAARIETELRGRLQVRAAVSVVAPGSLPRSDYKTPLVH